MRRSGTKPARSTTNLSFSTPGSQGRRRVILGE